MLNHFPLRCWPAAVPLVHAFAFRALLRTQVALHGGCLRSSSAPCSPNHWSMEASSSTTSSFSSRRVEWFAPRERPPALRRTRSPGARSHPHRSAAVAAQLAAMERVLASPWSPTHTVLCAGPLDCMVGDFLAVQRLMCALHCAESASRARALI